MSDVLKKGSQGALVKTLQENLKNLGYTLQVDGIFGNDTENAVRHLQKTFGYDVDGIVGKGTMFLIDQQIGLNFKANLAPANVASADKSKGGGAGNKGIA